MVIRIASDLSEKLQQAIHAAQEAGALPDFPTPDLKVTPASKPEHGDYAAPVGMQLAREARMKPPQVAEIVIQHFPQADYLGAIENAGGFVNFRLSDRWLQGQVDHILAEGERFGQLDDYAGRRAQVECVSANPTGPITVGRIRGGVMGDTLARLLRAGGYDVEMEYYFNNAGAQMRRLGLSLQARYREKLGLPFEFPEDGYQGAYLYDIADLLIEEQGDALADETDYTPFKEFAEAKVFEMIRASLRRVNITFDTFFNENSLYESGAVDRVIEGLRKKGLAYDAEGAIWFKTTDLGMEQDKVLVKSTGEPTYRTPDIAYHIDKLERGFDPAINILGADHQEEYPDVAAGLRALGYDDSKVHVIIHQFVTLKEGGVKKRMRTRKGEYVTLDELVDDIGPDAVRYFILARSPTSHMEFDLDLARQQSNENPVFYIQNAHVRCASIARVAAERGFSMEEGDVSLLTDQKELTLIRKLIELPEIVELCVGELAPHKLAFWAHEELARAFHPTYDEIRALHSDVPEDLARARLKLYAAARIVLARTLDLMGMNAPDVM
jgi:arginyl-tRNA synthetase